MLVNIMVVMMEMILVLAQVQVLVTEMGTRAWWQGVGVLQLMQRLF